MTTRVTAVSVHCTLHTVHCTLYIDLGRDVISGVNDAGGQFAAGVNDTGGAPLELRNFLRIFVKIKMTLKETSGPGEVD
jgi:hypothetical protein